MGFCSSLHHHREIRTAAIRRTAEARETTNIWDRPKTAVVSGRHHRKFTERCGRRSSGAEPTDMSEERVCHALNQHLEKVPTRMGTVFVYPSGPKSVRTIVCGDPNDGSSSDAINPSCGGDWVPRTSANMCPKQIYNPLGLYTVLILFISYWFILFIHLSYLLYAADRVRFQKVLLFARGENNGRPFLWSYFNRLPQKRF